MPMPPKASTYTATTARQRMARSISPSTMKKIKPSQSLLPYDFLRAQIKRNKLFKNLNNDDIDFIIYNQLKSIAQDRGWIKQFPLSFFQHR